MGIRSRLQRLLSFDTVVSGTLGLCEFSLDLDLHTDNSISSLSERYSLDRASIFVGAVDLLYACQYKNGCFFSIGHKNYDTVDSLLGLRRSKLDSLPNVHVLPQKPVRVSFMLSERCAEFVDRTLRRYSFGDSKQFCRDAVHLYSTLAMKADEGTDVFIYGKRSFPMRLLLNENYGERFIPSAVVM